MSLEDLGNIGELVAAIGVIASLIYLAVQIRQNTRSMRTTSLQNVAGDAISHLEHLFKEPELARIWISGIRDLETLSESERTRFAFFALSFCRRLQSMHHHHREGLLPDEEWEGLRASVLEDLAQPGMRTWWESNAFRFNPHFRGFFGEVLKNVATPPVPKGEGR